MSRQVDDSKRAALARRLLNLAVAERTGILESQDKAGVCPRARLEAVLELEPSTPEAFTELGLIQLGESRARAGRLPVDAELFRREDTKRIPRHELALVEKTLVRARDLKADSAKTLNALGVVAAELEEYSAAQNYFTRASRLAPHATQPVLNRAGLALEFKNFARAERLYSEILEHHPDNLNTRLGLSVSLIGRATARETTSPERQLEFGRADELLRETAKLYPDHPEVLFNLASLNIARVKYDRNLSEPWPRLEEAKELLLQFLTKARALPGYGAGVRSAACKYLEVTESTTMCFPELSAGNGSKTEREARKRDLLSELCDGTKVDLPDEFFE